MMSFMQEGGVNMWLLLVTAIAAAGIGFTRSADRRGAFFRASATLLLIEGVFGMGLGMRAVAGFAGSPKFAEMTDQAALVATGLGELANNGLFGAALALLLAIAATVSDRLPTSKRAA